MPSDHHPLVGPPPEEIPLEDAPLVRVVAQVRFPTIASIERQEFIASFQEAVRSDYPIMRLERSRAITLAGDRVVDGALGGIWRFYERTPHRWRVSLAPSFVALETKTYTSRDDFMDRLEKVLVALQEHVDPQVIDRLGVRYIDRLIGEEILGSLSDLVRAEVKGILGTRLAEHAVSVLSENQFDLPEEAGRLRARWGLLPAGATVDPAAIPTMAERSWLLDLDAFLEDQSDFEAEHLAQQARALAERIYAVFRWAVTDDFLRRFGGDV